MARFAWPCRAQGQFPALGQRLVGATKGLILFIASVNFADAQLKFAAIGNYGFDAAGQQIVAESLKQSAAAEHVSLIVSPGSNFHGGISSSNDTRWQEHFESMYGGDTSALKVPFFTVLGAEDWAGDFAAMAERTQMAYDEPNSSIAKNAPKWTLPNWWYHYVTHFPASTGSAFLGSGHRDMSVGLIFIDTWILSSSFPFSNISVKAWNDLEKTLQVAPKILDYIIVVGDKPIYSSGSSKGDAMLRYYLEPLLKKAAVDAYISGYDFDMELIEEDGIAHINCGSGSVGSGAALVTAGNSVFFSGERGFCLFELTASGLVTKFVSGDSGETLFESSQALKNRPERSTIDQLTHVNDLPQVTYWPVPPMGKLPGRDVFVRVVGTIGLCILTLLTTLTVANKVSRYAK